MHKDIIEKKDVQKILDGDHNLDDILYQEIIAFLFSINKNYKARVNTIKDIAQNSFLVLLLNLKADKFKYESTLNTYAKAIAKKQFYKYLEQQNDNLIYFADPSFLDVVVENEPCLDDLKKVKWKVYNEELKNLHSDCRKLLKYFTKKKSHEDIAKKMGYPKQEMVKDRIYRCKGKLVQLMNNNPLLIKAKKL